jgi:MerR family Zn(II)-responsive transcriptional regulator of zntA
MINSQNNNPPNLSHHLDIYVIVLLIRSMPTQEKTQLLQIGEVAARAGVTVRTVRYYLEKGFIQAADRSPGGFYLFTPDAVDTVFYIQKLKDAGLLLKDIEKIYQARVQGSTGDQASTQVVEYLDQEKEILEQKIRDYQKLHSEIEAAIDLAKQCHGCSLPPTRETCLACTVISGRDRLPLPIQAIL